jgi:Restriction endonuclease
MLDVFTEQTEVLIKDGIANLYWFKGDLQKAWHRAGVPDSLVKLISIERNSEGLVISKRRQMDRLYEETRGFDFNKRLEISRNFVRTLVEHKNFVPQDPKHRIEIAERAALKLRELIQAQETERAKHRRTQAQSKKSPREIYEQELESIRAIFESALSLPPQQKGYQLEKIFVQLMRANRIQVEEPFRIVGEQLDGAIRHDGHYYLIELKWFAERLEPKHIGSFYFKVDGKMGARGIAIAMNGYMPSVRESIVKGKELKVMLLDGNHLSNVIYGLYTFAELLDHAIKSASLYGELYCSHALTANE